MTSELREAQGSPLERFEFEPHNCFACGSLNAHGLQLDLHLEPGRSWTEFQLDRRFEGWEGIAHGGILCTILDEVMAWALVAEDNWGVTARMQVAFKKPVPVGTAIRADGWVTRSRRRIVDAAGSIVDTGHGRGARDRRGHLRGRRRDPEAAPARALRVPVPSRRRQPPARAPALHPRWWTRTATDRGRATDDARAPRPRAPRPPARRRPAPSSSSPPTSPRPRPSAPTWPSSISDPDAFTGALRSGFERLADPEYLEGAQRVAPGIGPIYGVRWPLMAAVARGFRGATRKDRATPLLFIADRLFREDRLEPRWFAFGLLERTLATETERTWQLLRRGRARSRRLDHGRFARPSVRQGRQRRDRTAGPSSNSWSSRRRAGSDAWSARRSRP